MEGLLQNFKNVALLQIILQTGISIHKIFVFVLGTIFVLRRAKFCCVVVLLNLCSYYLATTKPVLLHGTPKQNANIFFMY
jgi:hypothetical protein